MTRETKIGLLVGLAFIIVIGILLSDHLTSSTEPPAAPISGAGGTVRGSVSTPVVAAQPPVTVIAPPPSQPTQTVPTVTDLSPKPQPVKIVQIPPPHNEPVTITHDTSTDTPREPAMPGATARETLVVAPVATPVGPGRSLDPVLEQINAEAQKRGEAIVPVAARSIGPVAQPVAGGRTYKAEPGDHLSRIAQKCYGSNAKVYRDAIIAANPSLQDNPNLIIEGRTYNIPVVKPEASVPDSSIASLPKPVEQTNAETVYVVQEGDNLTRIAIDHVGAASAVAAIKELNRDLLKGSDIIRPGMKLRLPAKSLAAYN